LFNLVEYGIPIKTIETLVSYFYDNLFSLDKVVSILGDGEKTKKINEFYYNIDKNSVSSYALSLTGLSTLIVEKIANYEHNLENLYDNLSEMSGKLNLQIRTVQIIEDFCRQVFNRKRRIEPHKVRKRILEILSDANEPLTGTEIWGKMQHTDEQVSYDTVFEVVSELHNHEIIMFSPKGYKLKLLTLENVLAELPQYDRDLISLKMQGYTLQSLSEKYQLSRQRILQKINSIISKLPVVQHEEKYSKIFQQYNISLKDAVVIFETDITFSERLYQYIQLKYVSQSPGDKVIDYLRDYNVINSDFAKKILLDRGKIFLNGELIDNTFIELFKFYTIKKNTIRVNLITLGLFVKFLEEENIHIDFNPLEDKEVTYRKLENSGSFIRSKDTFINVELLKFEHDILRVFEDFLSTVSCLVSTELLIKDKKELLDKYNITDKHELHAILKFLYANKYQDIRFTRTPHIEQLNYDKAAFIDSLVEVAQPMELNDFYEAVNQLTGIETNTFAAYASGFLSSYIHNGIVESVKYDLSKEEKDFLLGILNTPLISVTIFEKIVKLNQSDKTNIYLRNSVLEQIGYKKIGLVIVKNQYTSIESAMIDWLNDLPKVIDSKQIYQYIEESYLKYRMSNIFNKLILVWIDKNSLLSTEKVLNRDELLNFRNQLIEKIPKGHIFTTHYLLKISPFRDEINLLPNVKTFGIDFLTNIIKSHSEVYSNNGESTILRKGMNVKRDDLICYLVNREVVISAFDLRDKLLIDYGISNVDINQSYIRQLGFYFSDETQMIYLNKEIYIKKVSDYLDE
jgi:hypothetical protein